MIVLMAKYSILLLLSRKWLPHEEDTLLVVEDTNTKATNLTTAILKTPDLLQGVRRLWQTDRLQRYCKSLTRIVVQAMVEAARMAHTNDHKGIINSNLTLPSLGRIQ